MGSGSGLNSGSDGDNVNPSMEPDSGTPPLTLATLLLWVTFLTISVGVWITLLNGFGLNITGKLDWFSIRYHAASAVSLGTGMMSAALMGLWWYRGRAWTWQPGHICLLLVGLYELATVLALGVDMVTYDPENGTSALRPTLYRIESLAQHCGIVLLLGVCLCLISLNRFWQFVLGLIIFYHLLILAMINPLELPITQFLSLDVTRVSGVVTRIVISAVVVLLSVWELIRREWRDWLHWVGVGIILLHYSTWLNSLLWL